MSDENDTPPIPEKTSGVPAETALPPSAPMFFRTLAFIADGVLVLLAIALALKLLLPVFCPAGLAAFSGYLEKFSAAYENLFAAAAAGRIVSPDALNAVVEAAAQDEDFVSFFESAYGISFCVALLYFALTEYFLHGQTPGKKMFGLRTVIFGTERPPFFLQALSRAFWKAASIVPAGLILSILVIVNAHVVVFARRHRGWHDKLARTEVVDERRAAKRNTREN